MESQGKAWIAWEDQFWNEQQVHWKGHSCPLKTEAVNKGLRDTGIMVKEN